jgi:hypothetical protein
VNNALQLQKIEKKKLGVVLVENGYLTEANLITILSTQLGIPKILPTPGLIDPALLKGKTGLHKVFKVYWDSEEPMEAPVQPATENSGGYRQSGGRLRCSSPVAGRLPSEAGRASLRKARGWNRHAIDAQEPVHDAVDRPTEETAGRGGRGAGRPTPRSTGAPSRSARRGTSTAGGCTSWNRPPR